MRALLDNDFFAKLGGAGLLNEVLEQLDLSLADCARLGSLTHKLRRGKWAKELGPAARTLEEIASQIAPVPADAPAPAATETLLGVPDIDPGEALLLGLAAHSDALLLFTGDKRALRALNQVPAVRKALQGRIVTVEAAFIVVCESLGVAKVKAAYLASVTKDIAIRCALGAGTDEDVISALRSYQERLIAEVGPDLLWEIPKRGEGEATGS
jgi:hypothetical protein